MRTYSDRVWEEGEEVREDWALVMKCWRVGISAALLLVKIEGEED